jgi:predicted GNAT family N-acyltransferase
MKLEVKLITNEAMQNEASAIREKVFVIEQNVSKEEEYDEFEETSRHFLALLEDKPVGTARWRFTEKGIKLERFAVLSEARGKGVGQALVRNILQDVQNFPNTAQKMIYLHAQITAMPLYKKFGFQAVGEQFEEANIQHYKMILKKF